MPVPKKKTSKSRRDKRRYQGVPTAIAGRRLLAVRFAHARPPDVPHVQDVQGARDRAARGVNASVTVALDAMGSDRGPEAIVAGARDAVERGGLRVLLCGAAPELEPLVRDDPRSRSCTRPYVISHEEEPARAARERDDASVVTCMRLVHEGRADAAVSAGATGAVLAAGLLELRRLPGVLRPAIVQPLPSWKGPIVVLDIGATPDPRPNQLHQFAHMGTAFSASVLGVHEPRVGLLSNGHEEGKGNRLVIDSYRLLADDPRLRFAGNIEGRDVPLGAVDVVVTDGFTGNVVLKLLEGTGRLALRRDPPGRHVVVAGQARRPAAAPEAAPAARQGQPRHLRRLVPDRPARDRRQGARRLGLDRDLERARGMPRAACARA